MFLRRWGVWHDGRDGWIKCAFKFFSLDHQCDLAWMDGVAWSLLHEWRTWRMGFQWEWEAFDFCRARWVWVLWEIRCYGVGYG